jgi:hypothetical protein
MPHLTEARMRYWLKNSGAVPLNVVIERNLQTNTVDPDAEAAAVWTQDADRRIYRVLLLVLAERYRWQTVKIRNITQLVTSELLPLSEETKMKGKYLFPHLTELIYDGDPPRSLIVTFASRFLRGVAIRNATLDIKDWTEFVSNTPDVEQIELYLVRWTSRDARAGTSDCGHILARRFVFATSALGDIANDATILLSSISKSTRLETVELFDSGAHDDEQPVFHPPKLFHGPECQWLGKQRAVESVKTLKVNLYSSSCVSLDLDIRDLDQLVALFPNVEHFTFKCGEIDGWEVFDEEDPLVEVVGKLNRQLFSAIKRFPKLVNVNLIEPPINADSFIDCLRELQNGASVSRCTRHSLLYPFRKT